MTFFENNKFKPQKVIRLNKLIKFFEKFYIDAPLTQKLYENIEFIYKSPIIYAHLCQLIDYSKFNSKIIDEKETDENVLNIVPLDINNSEDEEKSNLIDFLKSNDNTERELMQKETQKMVQEALGKLKDNYKMVLTLRDIEDYSYEEIAKMMDASVENVKIWIFRARNRLKKILTEGGNIK